MRKYLILLSILLLAVSCKPKEFYYVRHALKFYNTTSENVEIVFTNTKGISTTKVITSHHIYEEEYHAFAKFRETYISVKINFADEKSITFYVDSATEKNPFKENYWTIVHLSETNVEYTYIINDELYNLAQ